MTRPLILGIGNVLMGDEGVGSRAAAALADQAWPAGVTVVDGGTGGFHLLEYLTEFDPIVMIDATMDGRPDGTVSVLRPRYAAEYPRSLTAHDIGLRDLVDAAALTGRLPPITLVTVSIGAVQATETALSTAVSAALPRVGAVVRRCLETELGLRRDGQPLEGVHA